MQLDLYVNKKFEAIKIIKLVLKRKDWGKTYTLYKTTTHEVLTQMRSYNFTDKYATFDIKINEINGNGYYSSQVNIYTDREDYTIDFINNLFLKSIICALNNYRLHIFEDETYELFPYVYRSDKTDSEWIKLLNLENKVSKVNSMDLSNEEKEDLIDTIIDKALDKYENEVTYKPREKYIKEALASNREQSILDLITEIRGELNNEKTKLR